MMVTDSLSQFQKATNVSQGSNQFPFFPGWTRVSARSSNRCSHVSTHPKPTKSNLDDSSPNGRVMGTRRCKSPTYPPRLGNNRRAMRAWARIPPRSLLWNPLKSYWPTLRQLWLSIMMKWVPTFVPPRMRFRSMSPNPMKCRNRSKGDSEYMRYSTTALLTTCEKTTTGG